MENKYFALIEIPEGDDRRRHFDKKRNKVVDLGPLKNAIPVNNGIEPINYGFILNTHCEADDDEVDVNVLSERKIKIGEQLEIFPIALILRKDDDNKVIATDQTTKDKYKAWKDVPAGLRKLVEEFTSEHFRIISIENSQKTKEYLLKNAMGDKILTTKTAGGVVINRDGKVLIVNQEGTSWSLPKGHIEDDETALDAAQREIYEESGIKDLEFIKKLGTYRRHKINKNGEDDTSELKTIQIFLLKTEERKTQPIDHRNPEIKWLDKNDVSNWLTHRKDKEFFESIKGKV